MNTVWEPAIDMLRRRMVEAAAEGAGGAAECARIAVDRWRSVVPADEIESIVSRLIADAAGVGPLEELLADPRVDEVMVNGPDEVWVERGGVLELTSATFGSVEVLRDCVERLLAQTGRRVDDLSPLCDARLPDGSRVNVALPPLAIAGPTVTIRRFRAGGMGLSDLVAEGTLPDALAAWLAEAVVRGEAIVVSGATGAGKTTTLAALARAIPHGERIVTIEDSAEISLDHPHVVRLEARPAGPGGEGAVSIGDLVRNALRMRPDRVVVGEVRGAEVLDMIEAMSTGHAGSLSTVHAGSPQEAIERLAALAQRAAAGTPHGLIEARLAGAIDLVVQQERLSDGRRVVSTVARVEAGDRPVAVEVWRRSATAATGLLSAGGGER